MRDLVVAITGASGSIYAVRLLEMLVAAGRTVHLTLSPAAVEVIDRELGLKLDLDHFDPQQLLPKDGELPDDSKLRALRPEPITVSHHSSVFSDSEVFSVQKGQLIYHHYRDYFAPIASGSFLTDGMVVCPCSGGTLAGLATGQSQNLIHRAADVHLKERRKLVLVPRETPLSSIALGNMKTLSDQGVVILPAMPGFYHNPKSMHDLIDFVVARICDQLGVRNELMERWGG
ncbi:MAG: flavin prenyltransferase UbiX [Planctomycetaceae bacterium]|nr:flavin prenyltransferase UbiX [Planctomycetaceae bacterium]